MCGIASFLSNSLWRETPDLAWIDRLAASFNKAARSDDVLSAAKPLAELAGRFQDIMSFGLHMRLVSDPATLGVVEGLGNDLRILRDSVAERLRTGVRTDQLEAMLENLKDYLWQITEEVLANVDRVKSVMPGPLQADASSLDRHYLAWTMEQVLESIDKLEVRGRDSSGIAVAFTLPVGSDPVGALTKAGRKELQTRTGLKNADTRQVLVRDLEDGRTVCRFLYKVAQLVGKLGDNGRALRQTIAEDKLLWAMSQGLETVNIIAHTRWASNGIISVPNCHPVDGLVEGDVDTGLERTMFVLNGDVDNYRNLVEQTVVARGAAIPASISTDAKILPVLFHLDSSDDVDAEDRFRNVLRRCEGSLAVVMQNLSNFESQYLAQKGSGQSFYVGSTINGWVVASEAYGLAARCRVSYPMAIVKGGGVSVVLRTTDDMSKPPMARTIDSDKTVPLKPETIEIFSRDIFRGDYDHYIEKEIHEASNSVRNTLHGKYLHKNGEIEFLPDGFGKGSALVKRLKDKKKPIRRILACGQGTAAIASMGIAHFMRLALAGSGIVVDSDKGSELIGFLANEDLSDTLLIPVSQSGTTTDTNRVVDICKDQGAWINAVVNRRNSPLVLKSDSHLYTSNGRDVEMAVASTKAFYSQIAAGKLLSLWFADILGTMTKAEIAAEITELEILPDKIDEVLARKESIAKCAWAYAPSYRYWALVGNGANRVAAEEVRIKLSELCYKSIPCDVTEDKKHIDLSTEPLTLMMANDLPEMVVMDTVKEATIFKAHNGRPIVFCTADETRFDQVAEQTIKLPRVGGGLNFVLATVAGHWWGIEAAKAIDAQAEPFRRARILLGDVIDAPATWDKKKFQALLVKAMKHVETGKTDSALPSHVTATLANYLVWLATQPATLALAKARINEILFTLNKAIEEMTRPIDTIRHQAKTVTVGISRPQD